MANDGLHRRIWKQVAIIPPGHVASYGQIARLAGMPRAARMVGRALGRAPASLKLPWHRVINAQGRIALPQGTDAYRRQQQLLRQEGIVVSSGRVDLSRYQWQPSLDELVWGPGMLADGSDIDKSVKAEALCSAKLVAGVGFEPTTFRL